VRGVGALAIVAAVIGGCGGDDGNGEPTTPPGGRAPAVPSGQTLQLEAEASGQLRYDKKTLQADAGNVTIVMDNPASVPHDVAIEGQGVDEKGPVVPKGGESRVTATLKPGEYTFYCSVPGHRQAGMTGTLTIK